MPADPCAVPVFEALEPRLLFSADFAPAAWGASGLLQRTLDAPAAGPAAPLAQAYEVVFADARVHAADPRLAVLAAPGAERDLVTIEPDEHGLARVAELLRQQPMDGWRVVPHVGADGRVQLGRADLGRLAATELVVVDAGVAGADTLLADLQAQAAQGRRLEVLRLDAGADGVAAIGAALAGRHDIAALHVIAHGRAGALRLGDTLLDAQALRTRGGEIAAWRDALAPGADLMLYGCDVAAGARGRAFVDRLAALTGADVAASDDATGAAARGGDWTLEVTRGRIEAALAIDAAGRAAFDGLLATYTVTSTADSGAGSLRQAITDANANAGADTIAFDIAGTGTHTITLASVLPTVTDTVTIDATTDDSFAANGHRPAVVLDVNALAMSNGLQLTATADNSTVRGLLIRNFTNAGIQIDGGADGNTIAGNYIGGLDSDGHLAAGAGANFALLVYGANNTIGGTSAADRNVMGLSTGSHVVFVNGGSATGNVVRGNHIGVDAAGTTAFANQQVGITFYFYTAGNTAEGNVVGGGAGSTGIYINDTSGASLLRGNLIGLRADGSAPLGQLMRGITVGHTGAGVADVLRDNRIGPTTLNGIWLIGGAAGVVVQGNVVGTDAAGTAAWGSGTESLLLTGTSNARIGGTAPGEGNVFAYGNTAGTGRGGIAVDGGSGNALLGNRVFGYAGAATLAIDLGSDGATANDPGDADTGSNGLQNFPLLAGAWTLGGRTAVAGTLDSAAGTTYRLEFFGAAQADAGGRGAAARFLGATTVTTDALGHAAFSLALNGAAPDGGVVAATATVDLGGGAFGSSSELSAAVAAQTLGAVTVDTAADIADGDTTSLAALLADRGADGRISLREALAAANATPNGATPDRIAFQIPGTGVHTITLGSALPAITDAVVIDARTDDSFAANGGRPAVEIDVNGSVGGTGLRLTATADGSTVRGLVIRNYWAGGIVIEAGSDGHTIAGNYLGAIDADGRQVALPVGGSWALYVGGAGNTIGGTDPADRNVIGTSGVSAYAVLLWGSGAHDNRLLGNWVGLDASGSAAFSGQQMGIAMMNGAWGNTAEANVLSGQDSSGFYLSHSGAGNVLRNNLIGLAPDGSTRLGMPLDAIRVDGGEGPRIVDNRIAGASQNGILLQGGVSGSVVQGNRIGTDAGGVAAWGTGRHGILLYGAQGSLIGGTAPGEGNVVAFANGSGDVYDGIAVVSGTENSLLGNLITGVRAGAGAMAIDLGPNGPEGQDPLDADTGANHLQNSPRLGTATADGRRVAVAGTLDSLPGVRFRIEFFAAESGSGIVGSAAYLGSTEVGAGADGHADFRVLLDAAVAPGTRIVATATVVVGGGVFGDTSGLSDVVTTAAPAVLALPGRQVLDEDGTLALAGLGLSQPGGSATVVLAVQSGGLWLDLAGGARLLAGAAGDATLTLAGSDAELDAALRSLVYRPAADFHGSDLLHVTATDAAGLPQTGTVALDVAPVNDAPVLQPGAPALGDAPADRPSPVIDVAMLLGPRATDVDGDRPGLALTGASGPGRWQLSLDGGLQWQAVGPVGDGAARLLGPDALLRFVPDGDDGSATLRWRAWDDSVGQPGALADTRPGGGTGAFSSADDAGTLVLHRVHQAPQGADATGEADAGGRVLRRADFGFADPLDTPADGFAAVWIVGLPAHGRLTLDGADVAAGQRIAVAALDAGQLVYTGVAGRDGTIGFRVQDDGGSGFGSADTDALARVLRLHTPAAPVAGTPVLTIAQGGRVPLTPAMLPAADADTPFDALRFRVDGVVHGRFEAVAQPGVAIDGFGGAALAAGQIVFVHDGSAQAPGFVVAVGDEARWSAPVPATVHFSATLPPLPTPAPAPTLPPEGAAHPPPPAPAPPAPPAAAGAEPPVAPAPAPVPVPSPGAGHAAPPPAPAPAPATAPPPLRKPPWMDGSAHLPATPPLRAPAGEAGAAVAARPNPSPADVRLHLQWRDLGGDTPRLDGLAAAPSWHGVLRPIGGGRGAAPTADDGAPEAPAGAASASTLQIAVDAGYLAATGGLVWWASRAGGLFASVLATAPTWRQLDPLPILGPEAAPRDDGDDTDDDTEALFDALRGST